ncbi:hypothetical protein [Hymenobacter guriensis]|uniref:DUF4870 domain-containing protein n=1 Tax=Hymenobacter guriensis TaxID=2793065 RepID=A0ABS0L6W0_9BACT|nr:hypothetical protein [Hymenobacter guriensis]MBG8555134.1 hypothetical protein [Hymenobacter guriensis]
MPCTGTRRMWQRAGFFALLPLLLMGCHSQQAAFSFRPAPLAAVAPAGMPDSQPAAPLLEASVAPAAAPTVRHSLPARLVLPRRVLAARPATPAVQAATATARPQKAPHRRLAPTGREHDTLHLVLGGLLVIGGVLAGLLLGGWLGLGVGALIVLLGYYFLVMGIGGSQAWREIFQEFFNM